MAWKKIDEDIVSTIQALLNEKDNSLDGRRASVTFRDIAIRARSGRARDGLRREKSVADAITTIRTRAKVATTMLISNGIYVCGYNSTFVQRFLQCVQCEKRERQTARIIEREAKDNGYPPDVLERMVESSRCWNTSQHVFMPREDRPSIDALAEHKLKQCMPGWRHRPRLGFVQAVQGDRLWREIMLWIQRSANGKTERTSELLTTALADRIIGKRDELLVLTDMQAAILDGNPVVIRSKAKIAMSFIEGQLRRLPPGL